ncbi:MAG TPA: hypothetical protein DIT99_23795 [Candidatus Latescibacteria bacterium]|nr:hypothetical protein [Candidatus Latescibacterota bacterium]
MLNMIINFFNGREETMSWGFIENIGRRKTFIVMILSRDDNKHIHWLPCWEFGIYQFDFSARQDGNFAMNSRRPD